MKQVKPKHVAEYILLRVVGAVVCVLPYRMALALGWLLAGCGFCLQPAKVKRTKGRIRQVFGDTLTEKDVHVIAWVAWRNLAFSAVEMLRAPRMTRSWIEKVTHSADVEKLTSMIKSEGNVILAVPHMGNWEMAALAIGLMGIPIVTILREQKNQLVNAYLNKVRSRWDALGPSRDDPNLIRIVLRAVKDGRVLCILPDIRARTDALHVPFLGGEATVAAGMALFARQAGVPILAAVVTRQGWARHKWRAVGVVRPDPSLDKKEDWQRMTEEVMDLFDQAIREHPEQYFWYNKKWVLGPLRPEAQSGAERTTPNAQRSTPK